jgi:hypothetical protein
MTEPRKDRNREAEQTEEQKQQGVKDRDKASEHNQELLDEGIEESFPASDPPSVSHID